MELSDRKKRILKIVVEAYIRTAEPVGSRTIAGKMGGKVSSATIRNELSDLTELGYLEQPHTSAGRIPTPRGYRLYVDELMEQRTLSLKETEAINAALRIRLEELDRMISQAGQALSSYVNYPAYAVAAGKRRLTVRRFDLIPVDDGRRCIVVVMLNGNRVHSQLLRLEMGVEAGQFPMLSGLLNSHFAGMDSEAMGERLMDLTGQIPPEAFLLLSQVVSYAGDVMEEQQNKVFTAGARELLRHPEFQDTGKAHALMSFLSDGKQSLPAPREGDAMRILIGPENVNEALKDTSVVMASYDIGEDMRGLIGVVGPTRMDYSALSARLLGFAEGLSRLFEVHALPPKEDKEES